MYAGLSVSRNTSLRAMPPGFMPPPGPKGLAVPALGNLTLSELLPDLEILHPSYVRPSHKPFLPGDPGRGERGRPNPKAHADTTSPYN